MEIGISAVQLRVHLEQVRAIWEKKKKYKQAWWAFEETQAVLQGKGRQLSAGYGWLPHI